MTNAPRTLPNKRMHRLVGRMAISRMFMGVIRAMGSARLCTNRLPPFAWMPEYSISTMIDGGVEVEKLGYAIANWNRAQAQTKMAQLMSQFGDSIELVIANNDDMALGAIDALKASGLTKDEWPAVIGIDGTDVGLEAVKNKEMIGTVYNDKEGQADAMLNLAYELSTGGDLSDLNLIDGKYIRLPYARVTCDDVDSYMEGDTE